MFLLFWWLIIIAKWNGGFLDKILSLGIDMQISIYYEKQNTNETVKNLTGYINIMSKTYNDAKYIREAIQLLGEELYYINIYILIYSNSMKKLEVNMRRIENIAGRVGITLLRANFKQEKTFLSTLPLMKNDSILKKITKRNVLTDGVSSTYPFLLNEL